MPDDGFHAEALEYIALCDSVNRAIDNKYCVIELGAGWGPWISLGGVLARNQGIKSINLVGVEAQPERYNLMKQQLIANELYPKSTEIDGIKCKLIQGAVSSDHKTQWFPKGDVKDMGAATTDTNLSIDYRGLRADNFQVNGVTLKEIIGDLTVDLLHIDIQGAEFDVVKSGINYINIRVKSMMVASHSRVIEGKLIDLLYENGWYLHREKPCKVEWKKSGVSILASHR